METQINTLRLITTFCISVWSNKVKSQVLHYYSMSNVSRTFLDLLSSPHTDFPRFFKCSYWSLYQYKKQSFISVAVFSSFTNISSSLTLLYCKKCSCTMNRSILLLYESSMKSYLFTKFQVGIFDLFV